MVDTTKYSGKTRQETDLIGTREIPAEALYGVQSVRGFENFKISGKLMNDYPNFIKGMALTNKVNLQTNNSKQYHKHAMNYLKENTMNFSFLI